MKSVFCKIAINKPTPQSIMSTAAETKDRVVKLFKDALGYAYLVWQDGERSKPIEEEVLNEFLVNQQGYPVDVAKMAISQLVENATGVSANQKFHSYLTEGVAVGGQRLKLVNWDNMLANDISIHQDVRVSGGQSLDIVIYFNGIAVGVIDLEASLGGVEAGIKQLEANQKASGAFFSSVQILLAGNDDDSLRYGKVGSSTYSKWEKATDQIFEHALNKHLYQICLKEQLFELLQEGVLA